MRQLIFVLLLLVFCQKSNAQTDELDLIQKNLSKQQDSLKYIDMLNRISLLIYEKDIDSTFIYAKLARERAEHLDYSKGKADALNNLGIFFYLKGNLNLALKYFDDATKRYRQIEDTPNIVQSYMNLAMVYNAQDNRERSFAWFNSAFKLGKTLRQDSIMSLVIYNYVVFFPDHFNTQTKRTLVQKARAISTRYQDERMLITLDQLTANEMIRDGRQKEGLLLLDQAIDKAVKAKLFYVSNDIIISMGNHLLTIDQKKAIIYFKRALAMAEENKSLIISQYLSEKIFNYYDAAGDSKNALIYSRKLLKLTMERNDINRTSGIDYLDYALKESEVNTLKTTTTYQAILLFLALSILILGGIAILVIRKNNNKLKGLNNDIIKQNDYLNGTLETLQMSQADNKKLMKIVAHDLRNPISAMTSAAKLMLTDVATEEDEKLLSLIVTAGKNSLQMLNDLLQEQFKVIYTNKEPVQINDILQHCIAILNDKAKAKNVNIINLAEPIVLPVNKEKIWRVLSNIITNAIKFSSPNSTIEIRTAEKSKTFLIYIVDEGIGIPEESSGQIFDMFTIAKRKGTAGEDSFGLGLAICKQIIEAHGGGISFKNNPVRGATFIIELPKT